MFIRTFLLQPLGPALVLTGGAALTWLLYRLALRSMWMGRAPDEGPSRTGPLAWVAANLRVPIALLSCAAAGYLLMVVRTPLARPALAWTWQPLTVAGSSLEWRVNGWNWLSGLLILLLTSAMVLYGDLPGSRAELEAALRRRPATEWAARAAGVGRALLLGAAAFTFVMSANVLTLACCWVLLDAALVMALRPAMAAEPGGRAWSLLSLAGIVPLLVLLLLGEQDIRTPIPGQGYTGTQLGLLWLAAVIRAGVYPLHFWLMGPGRPGVGERMALHLVAPVAGLWMAAHVYDSGGARWFDRPEWAALGALALLGTSLAAWATRDEVPRWRWIAVNRAGLAVLAAFVAGVAGARALAWPTVTLALAGGLLALGQVTRLHWGWRLPGMLGALALWGAPATTGFLARSGLLYPTGVPLALPYFVVLMVAEALLAAALWQAALAPGEGPAEAPRSRDRSLIARFSLAFAILAAPVLVWGIFPGQLAAFAPLPPGDPLPALPGLLAQARRSIWFGLAFSGIAGVSLGILRPRIFGGMQGWQDGIVAVVSLDWLYGALAAGATVLAQGLRYFSRLGEGEGYLGWLALALLLIWVVLRG
jgi:hypothetical protein